jgi:hypothetical protein
MLSNARLIRNTPNYSPLLTRSDSDLGFFGSKDSPPDIPLGRYPSLSEAIELLENCLCWPPQIRRAAISLWCAEAGMHPTEVWDIAARLLEVAL